MRNILRITRQNGRKINILYYNFRHDEKTFSHRIFLKSEKVCLFVRFFRDESLKSNDFRVIYYLQIQKNMIYSMCISVGRENYTYFQVSMYYIIEIMLLPTCGGFFLFSRSASFFPSLCGVPVPMKRYKAVWFRYCCVRECRRVLRCLF